MTVLLKETSLNPPPPEPQSFQEAARLHRLVEAEVEAICSSSAFNSSKKSCEFLQYVVRVTLSGRVDSLKERSIGIDLMGRDVSYDPSTDATVRVRANEVRRRLSSFYADRAGGSCRIALPLGTYVPQFILDEEQPASLGELGPLAAPFSTVPARPEPLIIPRLGVLTMFCPAGIALFLFAFFLRWQVLRTSSYDHFWGELLHGRSTLSIDVAPSSPFLMESLPLAWLAGRYGVRPSLAGASSSVSGSPDDPVIHLETVSAPALLKDKHVRFLVAQENGTLHVTDRVSQKDAPIASVFTLVPGHPTQLWINSVNESATQRMIELLVSPEHFPIKLEDIQPINQEMQVVLPLHSSAPIVIENKAVQP